MINALPKTNEQLLTEIQELRKEYDAFKTSCETDVIERNEVEKKLQLSEKLYRGLFDNTLNGIAYCKMIYDHGQPLDFIYLNVNRTFEELTGLKNVNGKKVSEVIPDIQKTDSQLIQLYGRVASTGTPETFEMHVESLNMWFSVSVYSPEKGYFVAIFDVITKRKQAERFQSLSTDILSLLNSNLSLKEIIMNVLTAIQRVTKFSAVGMRLKNGDDFPYFAQHGFSEDFLLTENILTIKGRDGGICRDKEGKPVLECTCGMVITGKTDRTIPFLTEAGSFWTNNSYPLLELPINEDPRLNPRNNCIHVGYGSVALIPIKTKETIVGILQLNEKRVDAFNIDIINFFEGIGANIGAALMRKQDEESIAALSLRNQTLLLAASDGIHVLDVQGNVVEANLAFCKMLGYTRETVLQLNVADWDVQWPGKELIKKVNELISQSSVFETQHCRKDGIIIDVEINAVGVTIEGQKFLYASARDITDRKRVIKALKESQDRYKNLSDQLEAILDHLPSLVFYKDKENNFIRVNKYLAQGYKKTKEELEGKSLFELHPQELAEKYYQDDLSVIESGNAKLDIEEPWETSEGLQWVNTSKIPFIDNSGSIIGVIGISSDITLRKKAEEEIKIKNAELLKLIAEKDKFFSIIAHDLRSPFSTFLGYTRMMVEDLPSMRLEDIQKIALSMRTSATNLYRLLENLLEWSQMRRGIAKFNPESFLLMPQITESNQSVMDLAKKKGIRISYEIQDDLKVFADKNMFSGTIRNICSNAVKYSAKGGKVMISAKNNADGVVEISIKDTGIGMPKEMLTNLFNIDVNTSRKGTQGEPSTGLGLILCKEFVEKNSGKLWVESEEGKGSIFHFTLPGQEN